MTKPIDLYRRSSSYLFSPRKGQWYLYPETKMLYIVKNKKKEQNSKNPSGEKKWEWHIDTNTVNDDNTIR